MEWGASALRSPGRMLLPEAGLTKGGLAAYYVRVAPALLPHLRGRPFVMRVAPGALRGPVLFLKDVPASAPDWLPRAEIPAASRRGRARPVVVAPVVDDLR